MEDVRRAGATEIPLELHDHVLPGAPKYDPFTGELIRPLEVKPQADRIDPGAVRAAPVATLAPRPPVDDGTLGPLEVFAIPMRLFRPINLVVMGFIVLAHALAMFMAGASGFGFLMLVPPLALFLMLLLSHYGNVIDETGPTERSELPTPLRSVNWHDDTWGPFFRWTIAFVACYGPALLLLARWKSLPPEVATMVVVPLAIAGTIAFPAALLATMTSGSVLNLRPDRLIGVMRVCGAEYLTSVVLWTIAATLHVWGTVGVLWCGVVALNPYIHNFAYRSLGNWLRLLDLAVVLPALLAGIFMMHFFCWQLGTFYRRFHEQFPWTLQRYTGSRRDSRPIGFPLTRPPRNPTPRSLQ
jgi:hypothetical protein